MDATRKASLETECQVLRADLKGWEYKWSSEHDGAKPSREAIKGTPDIGMASLPNRARPCTPAGSSSPN